VNSNIYALLTPVIIAFILIEMIVCWYFRKQFITFQEAIANFGVALGNQALNVLVAAGVYNLFGWVWDNFRIVNEFKMNAFTFPLLFVSVDFIFYWAHRFGHRVNILWAAHSPHHSSQEMNFFVSLRASTTQRLSSLLFIWPLIIIGFKPIDIYTATALHVFMSFFHHTELVPRLWNWVEFLFTTPSNHRVHHGVNKAYVDKNFGDFLIIWDRVFGTYKREDEQAVYGVYDAPRSFNPITICFYYYRMLWRDAVAATVWIDKIKIWFMPPGWRPRGLAPPAPREEIAVGIQRRYLPNMLPHAKPYLLVHAVLGLVLLVFIIDSNSPWSPAERWVGIAMLWYAIINWSGILEAKPWLYHAEVVRLILTCLLFIYFFDHRVDHPASVIYLLLCLGSLAWIRRYFFMDKVSLTTKRSTIAG
jgi:alkylglycerol monooxygenase